MHPTCSIDGCAKDSRLAGMCGMHHQRKLRHGDPLYERLKPSVEERFWAKVDVGHPLGCWVWTAATRRGYGTIGIDGKQILAHRWAFATLNDVELTSDQHLDHLCRNPPCVNPDHLEVVDIAENNRRGYGIPARNARKGECANGHPLLGDNVYRYKTWRKCRTCVRERYQPAPPRPDMGPTDAEVLKIMAARQATSGSQAHAVYSQVTRAAINSAVSRLKRRGFIVQVDKVDRTPFYAVTAEGRGSMDSHAAYSMMRVVA